MCPKGSSDTFFAHHENLSLKVARQDIQALKNAHSMKMLAALNKYLSKFESSFEFVSPLPASMTEQSRKGNLPRMKGLSCERWRHVKCILNKDFKRQRKVLTV
jgi:hypothetical protein